VGLNAADMIGSHDIVMLTLDTLRHDVATAAFNAGELPNLAAHMPATGWERRHTPGSFTYAAHVAFFAGFLPTPVAPGRHERLFALRFAGSETTGRNTAVLDGTDIIDGLRRRGYHTICIGGVGFFNKQTPLGSELPNRFDHSVWDPTLGVTDPSSTYNQVHAAIDALPAGQRAFLFINISALHQPNCGYVAGATEDGPTTQQAALAYVDSQLAPLFAAMKDRGPSLWIVCSDHGTAYGEHGYTGHRVGHPVVYTVPYTEFVLP
jgi:hypothetical protein